MTPKLLVAATTGISLVGSADGEAAGPTRRTIVLTAKAHRLLAILALNDGWTNEQRAALRRWKR